MATPIQLNSLKKVLTFDHPPLCSGTISPPPEGFHLWYDKKKPKFIDFASATPEDLDLLAAACDPVIFDHGIKNASHGSCGKALEMDASNFSVRLGLAGSDLIRAVEDKFLHRQADHKRIKAELCKLNIYDEGSFIEKHRLASKEWDVLGSLVVIYPTPHEGGELALRYRYPQWKTFTNSMTASTSSPSLAYVAFHSDIEHGVSKVTSGRRITLTYNLYMVDTESDPKDSTVTSNPSCGSDFQITLRDLLKDPVFLPEGGTLGFGLTHLYPFSSHTEHLKKIAHFLKGEDANVYKACLELQLEPSLKMIYDDAQSEDSKYGIMLDNLNVGPYSYYEDDTYQRILVRRLGGIPVNRTEGAPIDQSFWVSEEEFEGEFIHWVSPLNTRNQLRDISIDYTDDDTPANVIYCNPCIIVRIDPEARAGLGA